MKLLVFTSGWSGSYVASRRSNRLRRYTLELLKAVMKQQQLSVSQQVAELPDDLKFALTSARKVMSLESKLRESTVKLSEQTHL